MDQVTHTLQKTYTKLLEQTVLIICLSSVYTKSDNLFFFSAIYKGPDNFTY